MNNHRIRVRTASRLHFGLLGWGPQAYRQFGGIGLMIESPGIELSVKPASTWMIEGAHSARVEKLVDHLRTATSSAGSALPAARIRIEGAPAEHLGLGVGTQLSLAVARAVMEIAGETDLTIEQLARLTGRGQRSGIGVHGFVRGGLIVDGGRQNEAEIPPLLVHLPFPEEWSILVVRPPGHGGLHGRDESLAFANLPPVSQATTDSLCRLVLLEILPAVIQRDLASFGAGLRELQDRVGASFAPAQGGIYATPQASEVIDELRSLGFVGMGQSSWGPTLYGFAEFPATELAASIALIRQRFGLDQDSVFWTNAANHGARFIIDP
jgi:beta-RFAP synthase